MSRDFADREWYIYVLKDPCTDEVRYVGWTTNPKRRYSQHISSSHKNKTYKDRWINLLLAKGARPTMEVIDRGYGEWQSVERRWIATYRMQGVRLTNLTDGGEGLIGRRLDEDAKDKIRQRMIGVPRTEEQRRKLSIAHKGKSKSDKHKEAIATSDRWRRVIRTEDGVVYNSISDAARRSGITYSKIEYSIKFGTEIDGHHWKYHDNASSVVDNHTLLNRRKRKVRCVESGIVYESVRVAAVSAGITETSLSRAINSGRRCRCGTWEYVDVTPPRERGGVAKRVVIRVEDHMIFNSVTDAARYMEVTPGSIGSAIKRNGKCKGFHWVYGMGEHE